MATRRASASDWRLLKIALMPARRYDSAGAHAQFPWACCHVTARGSERQPICPDARDRALLGERLSTAYAPDIPHVLLTVD